jgi:hypothetical protein
MSRSGDLHSEKDWYLEMKANQAIRALERGYIEAFYAADRKKALRAVKNMIPSKATIGLGDSATLDQIGFLDWLHKQRNRQIFDPFALKWDQYGNWEDFRLARFEVQRRAMTADVFLTGVNAVTLDGKLVSLDARGNRVAAMVFGPGKVIFVCGTNKLVVDLNEAIKRVKEYCAPINVKRHYEKHGLEVMADLPCLKTGKCSNCQSQARICRIYTIIDGWAPIYHSPAEEPPSVIIIGESLGI